MKFKPIVENKIISVVTKNSKELVNNIKQIKSDLIFKISTFESDIRISKKIIHAKLISKIREDALL